GDGGGECYVLGDVAVGHAGGQALDAGRPVFRDYGAVRPERGLHLAHELVLREGGGDVDTDGRGHVDLCAKAASTSSSNTSGCTISPLSVLRMSEHFVDPDRTARRVVHGLRFEVIGRADADDPHARIGGA